MLTIIAAMAESFVLRANEKLTAFVELHAAIWDSLLGSDIQIKFLGDLFLKNEGLPPIGSRAASITILASIDRAQ